MKMRIEWLVPEWSKLSSGLIQTNTPHSYNVCDSRNTLEVVLCVYCISSNIEAVDMGIAIYSRRLNQCNMRSRTFPPAVLCLSAYSPYYSNLQLVHVQIYFSVLCLHAPWNDIWQNLLLFTCSRRRQTMFNVHLTNYRINKRFQCIDRQENRFISIAFAMRLMQFDRNSGIRCSSSWHECGTGKACRTAYSSFCSKQRNVLHEDKVSTYRCN